MQQLFQHNRDCPDTEFTLYLSLEFGLKSFPGFVFCVLGTYRYLNIRHMAINTVRYTKMFKSKVAINLMMCVTCFLYMLVVLVTPPKVKMSSWINRCGLEYFSLLYLI
jgi:hypothetical protein